MSFMKALATVAVGLTSAKGSETPVAGLEGLKAMFPMGDGNPAAEQLAKLAEQFGVSGGADQIKEMMNQFAIPGMPALGEMPGLADMQKMAPDMSGFAGLGGVMNALQGAALATGTQSADLLSALFGGTPVGDAMEAQAKLMLRAMIQAAKADGDIDPEEQARILEQLGDDITDEEKAYVQEQIAAPFDLQALAADAGSAAQEQVYAMSLSAIHLDNPVESSYLTALAQAMGMSEEKRNAIHERMGVDPLSS